MLKRYRKTILLLILISLVFVSLINHYELPKLTIKYQFFNDVSKTTTFDVFDDVLINITGFKFLIKPLVCRKRNLGLFVIVTVPSAATNFNFRNVIRHSWGRWDSTIKVVFFLGIPESNIEEETRKIRMESDTYGDIVQGNFIDVHKNLSYKHVMILKWVTQYCSSAQFVVKANDNVVVDLYRLFGLLEEYRWGRSGVMACFAKNYTSETRSSRDLVVSGQFYTPYCSGSTIVYSSDVILELLKASRKIPYFPIEDVYVTGFLAREVGISAVNFDIPYLDQKSGKLLVKNPSKLRGKGPYILGPYFTDWLKMREFWIPLQQYNFKIEKRNMRRNVTSYTRTSD